MGAFLSTFMFDVYLVLLSMQLNGLTDSNDRIRLIILMGLIVIGVIAVIFNREADVVKTGIKLNTFVGNAMIYLFFILVYTYIERFIYSYLLQLMFFPLSIVITYPNYRMLKSEKAYDRLIDMQFYVLIILAIIYFTAQIAGEGKGDYTKNINTVYYLVFMMPFVISHKNGLKRMIGMAIIILCVFWSAKRAPLIAIGLVLLFVGRNRKMSKAMRIITRFLMIFLAALVLNNFFSESMDIDILGRLSNFMDDGGSGRDALTEQTIEEIKKSSYLELLIGHKLYPTSTVVRLGAHNDFLEVFYRAGMVGFAIYLLFYVRLFFHARACVKSGDIEDANLIYAALIIFIVVSFFSQLFFLPSYSAMVAIACNMAICRNKLREKREKNESV